MAVSTKLLFTSSTLSEKELNTMDGCFNHRFLIEVDCSLVSKHNSKLNGLQTVLKSQVFLALLSSSEPSFEYSVDEE
jgi:hypothetical protein